MMWYAAKKEAPALGGGFSLSGLSSPSADKQSAPTRKRATAETDGTTNEVEHFAPNRSTRSAPVSNRLGGAEVAAR